MDRRRRKDMKLTKLGVAFILITCYTAYHWIILMFGG